MQIQKTDLNDTTVELTLTGDDKYLSKLKTHVLQKLAPQVKVPGFRAGAVPPSIVEKNIDDSILQKEFLDDAVNHMYSDAVKRLKLRPVGDPEINLKKFVPYTELEFTLKLEVVPTVKLPDFSKLKIEKARPAVDAKDVSEVLASMRTQYAERKAVTRAAKNGDEVTIDFKGQDANGQPISGADGTDYPLALGSKRFIPGFEEELVGLKTGATKQFTVTFPKDYNVASLQSMPVTFDVTVKSVNELKEPAIDDNFATKVGPFKTVAELKADIKKQLLVEKQGQADRDYENQAIRAVIAKTTVTVPKVLLDQQIERLMDDIRQNAMYRGQTLEEFLKAEKMSETEYKEKVLTPEATERVKAGLILSEIADQSGQTVEKEELDERIEQLRAQYQDPAMRAELDKPENRQGIASRILTEKAINHLLSQIGS